METEIERRATAYATTTTEEGFVHVDAEKKAAYLAGHEDGIGDRDAHGRKLIKTGDTVFHKPSGEIWTVAYANYDNNDLAWCGWPEGWARISDCELRESCSDEESLEHLRKLADMDTADMRRSWARTELMKRGLLTQ